LAARPLPQTPLGELTDPLAVFRGLLLREGRKGRERIKGREGKRWEGKRERRGGKWKGAYRNDAPNQNPKVKVVLHHRKQYNFEILLRQNPSKQY